MNCINKNGIKQSIKKRNLTTLSQIRLAIAIQKLKPKVRSDLFTDCYESGLSWQECIKWINNVANYTGHKRDSFDYLCVRYNSVSKAEEYYKLKSDRLKGKNNPAYQHGGKLSPLSDKFIYADKVNKEEIKQKISKSLRENGEIKSITIGELYFEQERN